MMEAVRTSETSVDNHFTRQYIPEDNSEHCTCFNCCVLKLLGNSATNEKQLHATPNLVGIG
jgi:hypothetical protein